MPWRYPEGVLNGREGNAEFFGQWPRAACHALHVSLLPSRVALKERNRAVPESDSPVKRPGRKAAQVLSSEGEEEDEAPSTPKVQVDTAGFLV